MAGWSTWQWVILNFSKNFWPFDTPDTPGCASAVFDENEIWNRLKQFLPVWRSKDGYLLSLKKLFFIVITQTPLSYCKYISLYLRLFLSLCFHAVKGKWFEPTHTGIFAQNSFQIDSINSCNTSKKLLFWLKIVMYS